MTRRLIYLLIIFSSISSLNSLYGQSTIGMLALTEKFEITPESLVTQLNDWDIPLEATDISWVDSSGTGLFEWKDHTILIMSFEMPIPWIDLEGPCKYAIDWEDACDEFQKHQAHLIVTILSKEPEGLSQHKMLTQVLSSLLMLDQKKMVGVYLGSQSLVRPPGEYLREARRLKDGSLPLANWVFFGLGNDKNGYANGFTIGLKEFGYRELEVVDSSKPLEQVFSMLYDVGHYVLEDEVNFRSGETLGFTADQKIPVKITRSKFTDDKKVVRIDY